MFKIYSDKFSYLNYKSAYLLQLEINEKFQQKWDFSHEKCFDLRSNILPDTKNSRNIAIGLIIFNQLLVIFILKINEKGKIRASLHYEK